MSARRIAPSLFQIRMTQAPTHSGAEGGRMPVTAAPLYVVILSAVRLYREGLASALPGESCLRIAGTAANDMEALAVIASRPVDVVLFDVGSPNSRAMLRELRRRVPGTKIVALALGDAEQEVIAYLEEGIAGYVSIDGTLDDLRDAVQSAVRDEMLCSPRIAGAMMRRLTAVATERHAALDVPSPEALTDREYEVARLVTRGMSNKEIARELGIELATVKNHVHRILGKLGLRRRGEIAARR